MRRLSLLLVLLAAFNVFADARDEVRNAETSFAKAFADRDQAKFFSYVLDDASFVSPAGTLSGKKAIMERWSRFFAGPQAPFSWGPDRAVVNAAGTIGLTAGPVFDPEGHHVGYFNSTWLKQADGTWKVLFDGPGGASACLPEVAAPFSEGDITTPDGARLHYRKLGAGGRTIIAPLDFVLFDDFKQLADVATIITYDMRDRGRSSPLGDLLSVSIQQDVKDLETVREHFKVEKFTPVGFSYPGLMVAMYAMEHPEHVSRVIQVGPIPMKFGTKYPKSLTNADDAAVKQWQAVAGEKKEGATQKELCLARDKAYRELLVGDPAHAPRVKSSCDLENEWPVNLERHVKQHFQSLAKLNIAPADLAKITMPVLTIHGTKDRNAPYGGGREWAMSLPDARLVTVEGGAHVSWADDPVTVFGSIREFLRGSWPLGAEKVSKP